MTTDRIRRPINVGDTVQHVDNRAVGTVEDLFPKGRIGVRLEDGSTTIWYAEHTALTNGTDTCPSCQGSGEVVVERLSGRSAPVPFTVKDCPACRGEGVVR